MASLIRESCFAGTYYPDTASELLDVIRWLLARARAPRIQGTVRAVVVPHAPYDDGGHVMAEAFRLLEASRPLKRVVVLGPSHFVPLTGAYESPYTHWNTPLGDVCSTAYSSCARDIHGIVNVAGEAHDSEFAIEVVLPFLQYCDVEEVIPLSIGSVDPRVLAQTLVQLLTHNAFLVVSTDLSHYATERDARSNDMRVHEAILNLDGKMVEERTEACGRDALAASVYLARTFGWKPKFLAYDVSERERGVIGHGAYAFIES